MNDDLTGRLNRIVGLRNIADHDYQTLNIYIA
ncbi:hypothetical protein ACU6U9_21560 [Pseudomonas sp. HK3]